MVPCLGHPLSHPFVPFRLMLYFFVLSVRLGCAMIDGCVHVHVHVHARTKHPKTKTRVQRSAPPRCLCCWRVLTSPRPRRSYGSRSLDRCPTTCSPPRSGGHNWVSMTALLIKLGGSLSLKCTVHSTAWTPFAYHSHVVHAPRLARTRVPQT